MKRVCSLRIVLFRFDRLNAWKANSSHSALLNAVYVSTLNNLSPSPSNNLSSLPTVRHRVTETKETLTEKLKVLGAKHVGMFYKSGKEGNRMFLLFFIRCIFIFHRFKLWSDNNLKRTLFNVVTVAALDVSNFPTSKYEPLEKLHPTDPLHWLSEETINLYFIERMARKGNQKGRRLFMRNFLKDCNFLKNGDDIYFRAMCCAEMKKNVEYEVKVHLNCLHCEISQIKVAET